MKSYLNRTVVVDENTEVIRKVVERNGVATVRHQNQDVEVAPLDGSPLEKSTKWAVKKVAQA